MDNIDLVVWPFFDCGCTTCIHGEIDLLDEPCKSCHLFDKYEADIEEIEKLVDSTEDV